MKKYILLTNSDKTDILRMRKEGAKLREIAEYIGCSFSTVRYHLRIFKRNSIPCFDTANAFENWKKANCYNCKHSARYSKRLKRYKKCYCAVYNQLSGGLVKVEGISLRTYKAAKQLRCPYFKQNDNQT